MGGYVNHGLDVDSETGLGRPCASPEPRPQRSCFGGSVGDDGSPPSSPSYSMTSHSKFKVTLEREALEWRDMKQFGKQCLGRRISTSSRIAVSAGHSLSTFSPCHWLMSLFPVLTWLPAYNVRRDLLSDVIVGFTVAVLHIPQGMAYGLLAGVSPINVSVE